MLRIRDKRAAARGSGVFLALTALLLALTGCLIVLSVTASRHMTAARGEAWYETASRQGVWIVIASGVCLAMARIDFRRLVANGHYILLVVWIGLIAVLLFGSTQFGARRWISLGPGYLQVSEFAKIAVILAAVRHVTVNAAHLDSFIRGYLPALAGVGVTAILIAVEPDFGTTMFICGLSLLVLYLGGTRLRHILLTICTIGPLAIGYMIARYPHVSSRLSTFSEGTGEHVRQALTVMGAGGVFGVGAGEGRAQLDLVNMVHNDFIFAAIGEQFGLIGTLLILALFLLFLWHGLRVTMFAGDTAGFLVAFGLTFMVVFQAAMNVMVVTGLVPPKGIGLPFISYGGSSLLMLGTAVGILVNISRQGGETVIAADEALARSLADEEPRRTNIFPGGALDARPGWNSGMGAGSP